MAQIPAEETWHCCVRAGYDYLFCSITSSEWWWCFTCCILRIWSESLTAPRSVSSFTSSPIECASMKTLILTSLNGRETQRYLEIPRDNYRYLRAAQHPIALIVQAFCFTHSPSCGWEPASITYLTDCATEHHGPPKTLWLMVQSPKCCGGFWQTHAAMPFLGWKKQLHQLINH